jgi:hypothetical protein
MDADAAYRLYKQRVFAQPALTQADDGLFAKMRAEDKHANLRLVFGISRWVIERIDAIPPLARAAHGQDLLSLLTQANAVVNEQLRAYKGESVEQFRGLLMPALETRLHAVFGHRV